VVDRGADQDALLVGPENLAVTPEQLFLGQRPAALGLEQKAVAIEDDGGRRRR
jgi:hypothetical protein